LVLNFAAIVINCGFGISNYYEKDNNARIK
jgi:hypothetical protein